ncbi:autotransporter domain-containing protein [Dyella acidisoli]
MPHPSARATDIPLDVFQMPGNSIRLGIKVGVDSAMPEEYLFDTGSNSFNIDVGTGNSVAWFPSASASVTSKPYAYLYGNGTYGRWQQNATVSSIQFYSSTTGSLVSNDDTAQGLPVGVAWDYVTSTSRGKQITTSPKGVPLYQDLDWQAAINEGNAPEEGHFFGTFGASNFITQGQGTNGGVPGMLTTTGYIVEADGKPGAPGGACGQACLILNLTPALRAQFLSVVPWISGATTTFALSGANASTREFSTLFNYTFNGNGNTVKLPTLFDTGTPVILLHSADLYGSENAAGHVKSIGNSMGTAYQGDYQEIPGMNLTATGAAAGARTVSIVTSGSSGDPSNDVMYVPSTLKAVTYGMSFFLQDAVMFDLQNQATGYTPFYVTDAPIATGFTATATMGPLGLAGFISGGGNFIVANGGVAQLSGTNTYTGVTDIQPGGWLGIAGPGTIATSSNVQADGTFDISRASNSEAITSLSGAGTVSLGANTLQLTNADGTFSGQLSDGGLGSGMGGGLLITAGVETLSGANTYTGLTSIAPNGRLVLNGSVAGAVVNAGTLTGNGQIGGDLTVQGTIAPGNGASSYQALNVAGNYHQTTGSTYLAQINLNQSGQSSQIAVQGTATLDPGARLNVLATPSTSAVYAPGMRYTLLTADQGLTGVYTFSPLSLNGVLELAPGYDPLQVYLEVIQINALTAFGQTPNQVSTLAGIQSLPNSDALFTTIANLPSPILIRQAADQLSGEIHASTQSAFMDDTRFMRDAVLQRLRQAQNQADEGITTSEGPATQSPSRDLAWWGQFVGSWDHYDGNGNATGLSDSIGGFLLGADVPVGDRGRVGIGSGYTQTGFLSSRNTKGNSNDAYLSVYGGLPFGSGPGGWSVNGGLAYTRHLLTLDRSQTLIGLNGATWSRTKASTSQAFVEVGDTFTFNTATLEPYVQAAHVQLLQDGFKEQGDAAALTGQGEAHAITYATLGAHAATQLHLGGSLFTAYGTMGWRHASGYVVPVVVESFAQGSNFDVTGVPNARNAVVVNLGGDLQVTPSVSLRIAYDGQLAHHATDSGFQAGVTWRY